MRFWDAATGQRIGGTLPHAFKVDSVVFSPDGNKLLTGTIDGARLWDAATGKPLGRTIGPVAPVNPNLLKLTIAPVPRLEALCYSFSPDSKFALVGARLWDTATGHPRSQYLPGALDGYSQVSPDGKTIVSETYGGCQLYDATTAQPTGKPLSGNRPIFSPDSRTLLLRNGFSSDQPWAPRRTLLFDVPQPLPGDPARLQLWVEVITGRELDAGGEVAKLDAAAWQQRRDRLEKLGGPPLP